MAIVAGRVRCSRGTGMKILFHPLDRWGFHPWAARYLLAPFLLSHPSLHVYFHLVMPALQTCPGCLKRFTSQKAHLSQASDPLCRRLAKKRRSVGSLGPVCVLQKRLPRPSVVRSPTPHISPPPISPNPTTPIPGSPEPTFPGFQVSINSEESDDEEDELFADETTSGWEPPVTYNHEIRPDIPSDTEPDNPSTPAPPDDIRQRTWTTPRVVRFPDARAGEPVGSTSPSHSAYGTSLRNPSHSNPYAPFASKADWDVAEWAKLHGPSSTSFADLLKIDGV